MSNTVVKFPCVFLLLISKVNLHPCQDDGDAPDKMWSNLGENGMENKQVKTGWVKGLPSPTSAADSAPVLNLPESQRILASNVSLSLFKPERNYRPVPDLLRPLLLPTVAPAPYVPPDSQVRKLEVLCHLDRIYVRILKSIFTNPDAWKHLKVGTCPVNQAKAQHYYFLYPLNSCQVKRQETTDTVTYSNTLYYRPVITGPVARELPFSIKWECHYNKHHRVYAVGYHPNVKEESFFWSLNAGFALRTVDNMWQPIASWQSYVIGQPMYFEAQAPNIRGKRLYLNKCYLTSSPDPSSTPQYVVLDNHGCMVDSKLSTQSKFYACEVKTNIRFSVEALVFKDMISQPDSKKVMFINCEMSLRDETPTASAKSCSYNQDTKQWSELYGNDSVCACCDDTCPAPEHYVTTKTITSEPWLMHETKESVGEPNRSLV